MAAPAECTTCHKRRPGSKNLTAEGETFAETHGDMEALCKEVLSNNPEPVPDARPDGKSGSDDDGESPTPAPSH